MIPRTDYSRQMISIVMALLIVVMPLNSATFLVRATLIPQVQNLSADYVTSSEIHLSWNPEPDFGYIIYRDDLPYQTLAPGETPEYIDTSITPSTQYSYQIAAFNATTCSAGYKDCDEGPLSARIDVISKAADEGPRISSISSAEGVSSVNISFMTDEEAYGSIVYWQDDESNAEEVGFTNDEPLQTSYEVQITDLVDGDYYSYRIEACNKNNVCTESQEGIFLFGEDTTPPEVTSVRCPEGVNSRVVAVGGSAEPQSTVDVYSNGDYKLSRTIGPGGIFLIENVPIGSGSSSEVRLEFSDMAGNVVNKTCSISYDATPPDITISEIPELTADQDMEFNITTDETVEIEIYQLQPDDDEPPASPRNLDAQFDEDHVALSWKAPLAEDRQSGDLVEDDDISNYIIYRNGVAIAAVKSTSFEDESIVSGRNYEYKVSAVDSSCNEGDDTPISYIIVPDGTLFSLPPQEISETCMRSPTEGTTISSTYEADISLARGQNRIIVKAIDAGGNIFERSFEIFYDHESPEFEWTNLDDLAGSGVYIRDVKLEGKVSEPSDITIVVNEGTGREEHYTTSTDASGYFEHTIYLERVTETSVDSDADDGDVSAEFDASSTEFTNTVSITATDRVGRTGSVDDEVKYRLCGGGDGFDWELNIPRDSFFPSEIIPRHLLEGLAVLGFTYELEYRHNGPEPQITHVTLSEPPMSPFQRNDYDWDLVDGDPVMNTISNQTYGYVQINLKPYDPLPESDVTLDKEKEIEKLHAGRCFGSSITVGSSQAEGGSDDIGCVKLPVVITITYDNPNGEGTLTQKQCMDFSYIITPRLDTSQWIPESFLKGSADFLDNLIDAAQSLRKFTRPAAEFSLKSCLVSYPVYFIFGQLYQTKSCVMNGAIAHMGDIPMLPGEEVSNCDSEFCAQGLDDDSQDPDSNYKSAQKVQECYDATVTTERLWQLSKLLCKRAMCGTIPSFTNYVKNLARVPTSGGELDFEAMFMSNPPSYCSHIKPAGDNPSVPELTQVYAYSEASGDFTGDGSEFLKKRTEAEDLGELGFTAEHRALSMFLHTVEGDEKQTWAQTKRGWCEEEYSYLYSATCPLLRDPYKDSFCTFGNLYGDSFSGVQGFQSTYDDLCGQNKSIGTLMNDVSDKLNFCKADEQRGNFTIKIGEGENAMLYEVTPRSSDGADRERGHIRVLLPGNTYYEREGSADEDLLVDVTKLEELGVELNTVDVITFDDFNGLRGCPATSANEACYACSRDGPGSGCCPEIRGQTNAEDNYLPQAVAKHLCAPLEPDKGNIIDATGGIWDTITCNCYTGMDAYLAQIERAARLIRDCFLTILKTGDGSSGMCQQVLTVYVCDILYWAFDCLSNYADVGVGLGIAEEGRPSLQSIGQTLAIAGKRTEQQINGEYGENALFRNLFLEKKFMNAVCLFLFTGDFPSDLFDSVLDSALDDAVVVEPMLACSGNRRFQTFDPTTGIATFIYDVSPFILSGASDTSYTLELVCSDDGDSDCARDGEKRFDVTSRFGSGTLGNGEELDEEDLIVIDQASDTANKGKYRYDKMRITVRYTDTNSNSETREAECDLNQVGGQPPAFCEFDVLSPTGARFICQVTDEDGSAYFSQWPSPKHDTVYLGDPEKREITFNTYSVKILSQDGVVPAGRRLRIAAEYGDGSPLRWNGNLAVGETDIQVQGSDVVTFGSGASENINNIPRATITSLGASGGNTNGCYVFASTEDGELEHVDDIPCSGDFEAYQLISINGADTESPSTRIKEGIYDAQNDRFTDTSSELSRDFSYETVQRAGEEITLYGLEFERGDDVFELENLDADLFPYIVSQKNRGTFAGEAIFTFELLDESGTIISHMGKPQRKEVSIRIRTGTPQDYADVTDDETDTSIRETSLCEPEAEVLDASCSCGTSVCEVGEVCCNAASGTTSGVGFCFEPSAEDYQCDKVAPSYVMDAQGDRVPLDVSVAKQGTAALFTIDNIYDESESIPGASRSINVYLDFMKGDADMLGTDNETSFQEDSFATSVDLPSSPDSRVRLYRDIRLRANLPLDGCYDVWLGAIDAGGNELPMDKGTMSERIGILIKDSASEEIYTFEQGSDEECPQE